jgi:hypothetical protein
MAPSRQGWPVERAGRVRHHASAQDPGRVNAFMPTLFLRFEAYFVVFKTEQLKMIPVVIMTSSREEQDPLPRYQSAVPLVSAFRAFARRGKQC